MHRVKHGSTDLPKVTEQSFDERVIACRRCPRLVGWREKIALEKVRRFAGEEYWGKPVPSFGNWNARVLIVGLAPAAHGANRTGRMFTGDRSGDWLFQTMHRFGFCNQPASRHAGDGLILRDCRITAVAHCAPPQNKLLPEEIEACSVFLSREIASMQKLRVVITLGQLAYRSVGRILLADSAMRLTPFGHGVHLRLDSGILLIASYHPSQQNTFTGKLTREMFDRIFDLARKEIKLHKHKDT